MAEKSITKTISDNKLLFIGTLGLGAAIGYLATKFAPKMCQKQTCPRTIFERVGGQGAIDAAIPLFYKQVLADDRVKGYFQGVDMVKQNESQRCFFTTVLGGPKIYKGKDMREAHKHMKGLNDSHFDAIVELLAQTLSELGVDKAVINDIAVLVETVRADTLNK